MEWKRLFKDTCSNNILEEKKKKLAKIKIFQIYSSNYKFFQRELEKEFFDEFSKIKKKKKHIG